MSGIRVSLWLAVGVALFAAPTRARSEDAEAAAIVDLRIGFNGAYKVGHWTPLAVTLRSTRKDSANGELAVRVLDGDGISTTVREPDVTVTTDEDEVVHTLVKPGRPQAAVEVAFESRNSRLARTFAEDDVPLALLATQELFVEIGGPIGLERLQQLYPGTSLERPVAVLIDHPQALPPHSLGYEGVDLVVVTTSKPAVNEAWNKDRRAIEALDEWVKLGGRLVLCVGGEGPRVLAAESPLARFAPGVLRRVAPRGPGPWESFAGAITEPVPGTEAGRPQQIATAVLADVRGVVELRDEDIPLVVRAPYGFGEVLFLAADLDLAPFADWSARTRLLLRLLERSELATGQSAIVATDMQSIRLGYDDLAGQLRSAVGQFAAATVVPFWLVFFLALAYVAAVFPLEYLLAQWLRPRFEAAWVLLPLVLLASAAGAWYIAVQWKGEEILINKVEVADVDLAGGTLRGHTWLGLYSPRTDAFELSLTAGRLRSAKERLSWLGLPGTGLGGMNSQMVAAEQFEHGYSFSEHGGLKGIPLAAWSSKAFEASWHGSVSKSSSQLGQRTLDRQPLGILRNETGMTLRDCVLFYEGWSYQLGTLEPGSSVDIGRNQRLLTIGSHLTARRRVGDKEQATPYEPDGADLRRIVQAVLFHDAAGGRQYTSLSNRLYDRLDLNGQLRLGRAVLIAVGPRATNVAVHSAQGGEPRIEQELTFYRFVIPVDRNGATEGEQRRVDLRLN